jgi:hypothetical protein
MAKRKQQKTVVASETATTSQINTLSYQGKIKLQILHGNKIISTKTCTNHGLPELFKYISHALAGTTYTALRPCKVALFNHPSKDDHVDPATFNWAESRDKNILKEASPYVVYDATPVVTGVAGSYATVFRFKIPFHWLYSPTFNVLGLFTENNSACAYYLFTKEVGNKTEWDVQDLKEITGKDLSCNYSLVVEWTMEVSNK